MGGARVQYDPRKVLLSLNAMPRKFVIDSMAAFERWIDAVKRMTRLA